MERRRGVVSVHRFSLATMSAWGPFAVPILLLAGLVDLPIAYWRDRRRIMAGLSLVVLIGAMISHEWLTGLFAGLLNGHWFDRNLPGLLASWVVVVAGVMLPFRCHRLVVARHRARVDQLHART